MDFRAKKKERLEISMTPMIDVVFLLLIFFMVTTTFNRETALNIKLPEAEGVEPNKLPKEINLTIDAEGIFYLPGSDGLPHQLVNQKKDTLKQELVKLAGQSRAVPFIITADENTPHKSVITALDVAGQVGFKNITFAAIRSSGQN